MAKFALNDQAYVKRLGRAGDVVGINAHKADGEPDLFRVRVSIRNDGENTSFHTNWYPEEDLLTQAEYADQQAKAKPQSVAKAPAKPLLT